MEETEVIELEGKPESPWKARRAEARANLLWTYLNLHQDEKTRLTQKDLSEVLALGVDRVQLREAVRNLESRGLLRVDRSHRPHRYELLETETAE